MHRIVILGAGFGGLRAAQGLKPAKASVTIIDRYNHHLFQPLLYQVATAGLSPADIAYPIRRVVRKQKNTEVLLFEVTGIDREKKRVLGQSESIPYDTLIVATGARYNYFGHEKWSEIALSLKTISDATKIRQKILLAFEEAEMEKDEAARRSLLTFILVGGGPTGVEMAGAIAELARRALRSDFRRIDPKSARILVVEAGPRILSTFPERLSEKAEEALIGMGVEVQTQAKVEEITKEGAFVSGKLIPSKNVIWTAGVLATPVGKWLSELTDRLGRIKVKSDLSLTPDIFVIGDAACVLDEKGNPLPGVAPVALQEGAYVADLICRRLSGRSAPAPFHYRDKGNLATIGRSVAVADFKGLQVNGRVAWFIWLVVHVMHLIGFRNRVLVLVEWAWGYLTFHRGARLITSTREELLRD